MEIGINRDEWRKPAGTGCDAQPDWHGLRARFSAWNAMRSVMTRARERHAAARRGSFSLRCATVLAAQNERLGVVNRLSSGLGKRDLRMVLPFAGACSTGGRGPK